MAQPAELSEELERKFPFHKQMEKLKEILGDPQVKKLMRKLKEEVPTHEVAVVPPRVWTRWELFKAFLNGRLPE